MNKCSCVYIFVEDDKYELPIYLADSVAELAGLVGVTPNAVSAAISRANHKGTYSRYQKIPLDGSFTLPKRPANRRVIRKKDTPSRTG